ncbi:MULTISPECIES: 50S ribosomal protein L15 [Oleiagrimonas]|jgi:large subunit ribosomal protein L15|uniref:Large ribosomal subunit protein uL15 n=1 Tax=Oleiagrimonas citrea TaxID=1665687 RepID=A0A846ZMR0_9GAMM|nr:MULTISPECIES: 50S ribosomal protein L15 [Oleiagrimonas]NKZ38731.1 50S ribosomal protein L15 [Oleiagrimonas citrea]RAP59271.1 50S ribosomal protein L15 [Oleiagrimonas sp. MCCC 1A03011]
MRLNTIKPSKGSRPARTRVGRGIGSGLGKTGGRGHKGQHARSGGYHKVGFEGGQMPLQRRLPKVGFRSLKKADTEQVFLYQLASVKSDTIDFATLREAGLVSNRAKKVKIVLQGSIDRAVKLSGVLATAGAKAAIEAAGGSVE